MPPEISTTSRPTAKIRLTELVFSRLNTLAKVRNCVLLSDSATDIPRSKSTSQDFGRMGPQQLWETQVRHRRPSRGLRG